MRLSVGSALFLVLLLAAPALAQETLDRPLQEPQPYFVDSGVLQNPGAGMSAVHQETVQVPQAAWLRLYFGDVELEGESFLRVTSLLDGAEQELDSAALAMWSHTSAYFNGDSLLVELVAAPGTTQNRLVIEQAAWETGPEIPVGSCGICGGDDRVPSFVNYAARLLPAGCSSTVYSPQSCVVSAGHCVGGGMVIQFEVPPSQPNCNIVHPPPSAQFPIAQFSYTNGGVGNDWAVMMPGTNTLGELPFERYGEYRPIATEPPQTGDPLTIWGYGVDDQCERSQAQQTSSDFLHSVGSTHFRHNVDATFGSSGSSILRNGEEILGIATHCPCPNWATRIDHPAFVAARESICPAPLEHSILVDLDVTSGTPISGGLDELRDSDDLHLVVEAVHQGVRSNAMIVVTAQSPHTDVSELNMRVEVGPADASPVFLAIQLYDFSVGNYKTLSLGVVADDADTVKELNAISNPGAYLDSAGMIQARIIQTARAAQTPDGYTALFDQVSFTVRP